MLLASERSVDGMAGRGVRVAPSRGGTLQYCVLFVRCARQAALVAGQNLDEKARR